MKKVLITIGSSVAAVAIFAAGAFAAPAIETISAQLNHNVKFSIKGEAWNPTDAEGDPVAPIVYNETTYIPIRSAGEALGLQVGWDGATSTVTLGETATTTNEGKQYQVDDVLFSQVGVKKNALDMYEVTADLKNTSEADIGGVLFTATFYDADGNRLGTANGAAQELSADASKTVTLVTTDDLSGYASIKFQIDSQY